MIIDMNRIVSRVFTTPRVRTYAGRTRLSLRVRDDVAGKLSALSASSGISRTEVLSNLVKGA